MLYSLIAPGVYCFKVFFTHTHTRIQYMKSPSSLPKFKFDNEAVKNNFIDM